MQLLALDTFPLTVFTWCLLREVLIITTKSSLLLFEIQLPVLHLQSSNRFLWYIYIYVFLFLSACQGASSALTGTAVTTLLIQNFAERLPLVTGIMETVTGIAFVVGPILGSYFYQNGFGVPFIYGGLVAVISAVLVPLTLYDDEEAAEQKRISASMLRESLLLDKGTAAEEGKSGPSATGVSDDDVINPKLVVEEEEAGSRL